jgi:hypothetical protein
LVIGYVLGITAQKNEDNSDGKRDSLRRRAGGPFTDRRRKAWLECDGEPYDFRAVNVLDIGFLVHDIEVVKFICPRCGGRHQSLLFG